MRRAAHRQRGRRARRRVTHHPPTLADVEATLREEAAADRFSGAVLVTRHGKVLFSDAVGLADRDRAIPNTLQTCFRIGSMNKMITAVAILQLVEAGEIELTAPVGASPTRASPPPSPFTTC